MAVTYEVETMSDLHKLPPRVQPDWARNRCADVLKLRLVQPQIVLPASFNAAECARLKEKYHVTRAGGWGGLPVTLYDVWVTSDCDKLLKEMADNNEAKPSEPNTPPAEKPQEQNDEAEIAAKTDAKCKDMMKMYKVQPGKSWGHLHSDELRNLWRSVGCDKWYWNGVAVRIMQHPWLSQIFLPDVE